MERKVGGKFHLKITSAKGLTSAYLPLAMVGMRQKIKDFFMDNPLAGEQHMPIIQLHLHAHMRL